MSTPELMQPGLVIRDTLGAISIGALISLFLFGAITLQVYMYLLHFRDDSRRLKSLVGFVWICELAHCIAVAHMLYYFTISRYGDLDVLLHPPKSLPIAVLLAGMETWTIKVYFAERVRIMSGGKLLIPTACWTLSSVFLGMIFVTTIEVFQMTTLPAFQDEWNWLVTALLCTAVVVEVIIASSLCYYLNIWKKESAVSSTMASIRDIMAWTIETGIVTSVGAVSMAVCFVRMPRNFIWLALFVCLPRTVSNALLLSLNSRIKSRRFNGLIELDALNRKVKGHGYRLHRASIIYNSETAATSETVLSSRNSVAV